MDEMNDPEKNRTIGLTASVMDYTPVNISPKGKTQGDYFSRTIGPYDYWAIEYGYKPLPGGTEGEVGRSWTRSPRAAPSRRCTTPPTRTPAASIPIRSVNRFDSGQGPDRVRPLAASN